MPATAPKRFRVAFSFAGEQRAFVQAVAEGLAGLFGKEAVLYDKYHEAEFAHADLALTLPDLYRQEADLIVAVFCPNYEKKEWCGLEWRALFGLIKGGNGQQVMLSRFKKAKGRGLQDLAGFIELDHKTPAETITLILERLAHNEGQPRDFYTRKLSTKPERSARTPTPKPSLRTTTPNNLPRLPFFFGREKELERIAKALEGTGSLLVLDNLESLPEPDRAEMFAFLDRLPQGCNAIVTSRRRADSTAVLVRLDRLDWPAARELLATLAEQGNDRLRTAPETGWQALHETTGGNPLLMRWVAGQLIRGPRTLAQATERLRSPEARNDPLEFVFGDLLETFTGQESQVLAALVHFTLPAPVKFIAGLAELNEPAAQAALDDLAARALVVPDEEARHFLLVPLVADFLRRKRPDAVQAAATRLEDQAYALVMENGYDEHDRFPVLDEHWPTLAAALPLLVAGPNERLQTVCKALRGFLNFTGRWDEWLKLSLQGEEKAVATGDFKNAGWRAYQAGWVHLLRGQSAEVLACAERAEAHWLQPAAGAGARERATALHLRGEGYGLAQDYPAAIQALRDAVELDRTLSPESGDMAIGLNALAAAEQASGDLAAAERDCREALRIARAVGHPEGVASITGNLAGLALDRQDWPAAEALAREALPLAEKLGLLASIASNCGRLAEALARQGRPAEGLTLAQRAVALYTQLRLPDLAAAEATLKLCEGGEA